MSNIPKIMKGGKELTSQSVIANALIIEKQIQENEAARNVWEKYDPDKKYVPGNKVEDNGSSFVCLQPAQGKKPIDYPTYWKLIAAAGSGLSDATQLPIVDTGNHYTAGDTNSALQEIAERVGDLSNLETESNADLVNAINEINANVGEKEELLTTVKTSTVDAINELFNDKVNKNELVANVKDFGAVGNGTDNDSTAINNALNASNNIFIPEGTYYVGDTEFLIQSTKIIRGAGRNKTIILIDEGDQNVFHFKNVEAFQIKDLTIRKKNANASNTTAIYSDGCYNSLIMNVLVNYVDTAIQMENGQANTIFNFDSWYFTKYGILLSGGNNDHNIKDVFLNGQLTNGETGAGHGIRMLFKCEAVCFSNIEVILCNYAITTDGTDAIGNRPAYCRFTDCFFDSANHGALFDNAVDFKFNNCWFSNRPSSGCYIDRCEDFTFTNTSFMNSAKHGCEVTAEAKRTSFLNCSFVSNGTEASGSIYHGLYIQPNTTDFIVSHCKFYNGLGFAEQQAWGVLVDSGASDRYIITENLVTGNTAGGVYDGGTGTNKRVDYNF